MIDVIGAARDVGRVMRTLATAVAALGAAVVLERLARRWQ